VYFQWLPLTAGSSTRHTCDMDLSTARPPSRTDALLAGTHYQPLLQRLKEIIETEAKRKLCSKERRELEDMIRLVAVLYYDVPLAISEGRSLLNHISELAEPLMRVIERLEDEQFRDWVFLCVEAPLGPQRLDRQAVPARFENLLIDLRKIARRVPLRPSAKRGVGKPSKSGDLEKIVELLGFYWEKKTGKCLTRDWHGHEPVNPAMMFVHSMIDFIDAARLGELPTVTRTVVEAKRDKRIL
jgi:hypothetical protein